MYVQVHNNLCVLCLIYILIYSCSYLSSSSGYKQNENKIKAI